MRPKFRSTRLFMFGLTVFFSTTEAFSNDRLANLTFDRLKHFSPQADTKLLESLIDNKDYLIEAGIDNSLRLSHFLAQIAIETGGLKRLDENLNYRASVLKRVFSKKRLPRAEADRLAALPKGQREIAIANYVYGQILGNEGRQTNDGWDYRGSGYIQLTGRYNFRKRGEDINIPLEQNPDLARMPKQGLRVAAAYWKSIKVNPLADNDNIRQIRKAVNGPAAHGLPVAEVWLRKAKKEFAGFVAAETNVTPYVFGRDDQESAKSVLTELGLFTSTGTESDTEETKLRNAFSAYQKSRGLRETGVFDEPTLYKMSERSEWTNDIATGVNIENESADESTTQFEQGLYYDLRTGLTVQLASTEIGKVDQNIKSTGTKRRGSVLRLSDDEVDVLSEMSAAYAPYESVDVSRPSDRGFIPHSIILPDTRRVVSDTTKYPSSAVVQISFQPDDGSEATKGCSGALIGENFVLTAGHCVHGGGNVSKWHKNFHVFPGRNGPLKPFGSCSVSRLYSLVGWVSAPSPALGRLYDIGGMKLDCNVGKQAGWFGLKVVSLKSEQVFTVISGYPCDKAPNGGQWVSKDKVRDSIEQKLFYQNDTYGCMSGAPVTTEDQKDEIIAVHTNGLHDVVEPWNSNNAGTKLTDKLVSTMYLWQRN
jgi:predicted chitinase/V8-like Glu-specific endopeptidase